MCAEPPINELLLIDEQIARQVVCIYFGADMMTHPSARAVGERKTRNAIIGAAMRPMRFNHAKEIASNRDVEVE